MVGVTLEVGDPAHPGLAIGAQILAAQVLEEVPDPVVGLADRRVVSLEVLDVAGELLLRDGGRLLRLEDHLADRDLHRLQDLLGNDVSHAGVLSRESRGPIAGIGCDRLAELPALAGRQARRVQDLRNAIGVDRVADDRGERSADGRLRGPV